MDYTDLKADLAEYAKPLKLGNKILKSLNKELYISDPEIYNELASDFCIHAEQVSGISKAEIVLNWLECSYFNSEMAKSYLGNLPISTLLELKVSSYTQYKVLALWFPAQDSWNIPKLFKALLYSMPRTALDETHTLKLIIDILSSNKTLFEEKDLRKSVNDTLMSISFKKIPQVEGIKVMTLQPYLNNIIIHEISKYYPKGKLDSILSTAQALGVVENPDYWVQSLPSQQLNPDSLTVELPEL